MHNSDNIIKSSATISSLVGVFKSLSYDADLKSASLLNTAVQKLPPKCKRVLVTPCAKESWSLFTVKKHWVKPTLLDFNDWLKEKAEAHDLIKQTSSNARTEDNTKSVVKTKVASRTFAANTQSKGTQDQPQHRQRLQPLAALCVKVTTLSGSVGYLKKSLPLSEQR